MAVDEDELGQPSSKTNLSVKPVSKGQPRLLLKPTSHYPKFKMKTSSTNSGCGCAQSENLNEVFTFFQTLTRPLLEQLPSLEQLLLKNLQSL